MRVWLTLALSLWLVLAALAHASSASAQRITHEQIDLELPNYVGVQAGGSGYFQVALRYRVMGPLVVELGGLGFGLSGDVALNGSLGLSLEHTLSFVSPFISAGIGGGLGCGEDGDVEEDPKTGETVESGAGFFRCIGTGFEYTRIGVNINFERTRSLMLSLDGGFWYGVIGREADANRTFFWPMFGVGLYARFPFRS